MKFFDTLADFFQTIHKNPYVVPYLMMLIPVLIAVCVRLFDKESYKKD